MLSGRLQIIQARFRRLPATISLSNICSRQFYLSISITDDHKVRLVRLVASDHSFGIEEGRRLVPKVPRHLRICRFLRRFNRGREAGEDEARVLLECEDGSLTRSQLKEQ